MEPTLAAILSALIVLAAAAVLAFSRRQTETQGEKVRTMAVERGLGGQEIRQLEHLSRLLPETSMADLLISPLRFNRAVSRYVDRLRTGSTSESRYFGVILELTRLRRRVHPPGSMLRFLSSTREFPEAEAITLASERTHLPGVIWGVNEDHFDVRFDDGVEVDLEPGETVTLMLTRFGQGRYELETRVRSLADEERRIARLEHCDTLRLENRREFLRERSRSEVIVTGAAVGSPVEGRLHDISGGGVAFTCSKPVASGEPLSLLFALGDDRTPPARVDAVVLRQAPEGRDYLHHCRWDEVDEDTRETIIRYVFDLQRRRIRAARALETLEVVGNSAT